MFRKVIISSKTIPNEKLVSFVEIEKIKKNIKLIVDASHKAVIYRDDNCSDVFQMGEYKPFTKEDKKFNKIKIAFVSTNMSEFFPFETRITHIKDKINNKIYNANFSGSYTFSVRNERKLMGNFDINKNGITMDGFANKIENQVNSVVLPYIVDYFTINNISFENFSKNKKEVERHLLILLNKYLDDTYGVEVRKVKLNDMFIESIMELN